MGRKRRWKRKGETKDRQNPRTRARRARTYVARLGSVHVDVVGNDVTNEIRARQVLSRVRRRRRKCRAGTGNDTTRLFVVGHPDNVGFRPSTSQTQLCRPRVVEVRIRLRARRFSLASMSTHRVATMTRVRRCWRRRRAVSSSRGASTSPRRYSACASERARARPRPPPPPAPPPAPILPVEVTGYTTPALADIGRASLRVRFHLSRCITAPTGGLILGIRRHPDERFLPAVAAAPGDRGPTATAPPARASPSSSSWHAPYTRTRTTPQPRKSTETTPAGFEPSRERVVMSVDSRDPARLGARRPRVRGGDHPPTRHRFPPRPQRAPLAQDTNAADRGRRGVARGDGGVHRLA